MLALLNHPWLIEQRCEEIAGLELTYQPLTALKSALLDIVTAGTNSADTPLDASRLHTHLTSLGLDVIAGQVARAVTHSGDRFAAAGAEPVVVEQGWRHAVALHNRHVELQRALEAAERAYQLDQSEENFRRQTELKAMQSERLDVEQA